MLSNIYIFYILRIWTYDESWLPWIYARTPSGAEEFQPSQPGIYIYFELTSNA